MADISSSDFEVANTTGYKAGAKKTAAELAQMDAEDESLRKWKESLGIKAGAAAPTTDDPRNVALLSIAMETAGRPDVVIPLDTPDAIAALKNQVMTIKEGVEYRLKVKFRVNHDVVSGLKYLHVVKRAGMKVDKADEMLGSYGPSGDVYEKKFPLEEAPSGMLARGHYVVASRFIDDDQHIHLEWVWSFDIKKEWD
ncbi:immunoglobulin E-set [Chytriomyces sp. MP71]|nr:immunoglobulin E-set [Chytriomyces sp. MP71]